MIQSSVYTSDVGYLGKEPNPSIPWIGPGPHSNFPNVGPRYPMSEVFNTSDLCGQILPHGFRGTWWMDTSGVHLCFERHKRTKKYMWICHVSIWHTCTLYTLDRSEVYISRIHLYLGTMWLAKAHPRYPRLTCISIMVRTKEKVAINLSRKSGSELSLNSECNQWFLKMESHCQMPITLHCEESAYNLFVNGVPWSGKYYWNVH